MKSDLLSFVINNFCRLYGVKQNSKFYKSSARHFSLIETIVASIFRLGSFNIFCSS